MPDKPLNVIYLSCQYCEILTKDSDRFRNSGSRGRWWNTTCFKSYLKACQCPYILDRVYILTLVESRETETTKVGPFPPSGRKLVWRGALDISKFPSLSIAISANPSVVKTRKKTYYIEKRSIITEMVLAPLSF